MAGDLTTLHKANVNRTVPMPAVSLSAQSQASAAWWGPKMGRGFELSFSTIAMLVGAMVVLLVVLVFFRGSFEKSGQRFGSAGQTAGGSAEEETKEGGSLDIGGFLTGIKFKRCNNDDDCGAGEVCGYVCPSDVEHDATKTHLAWESDCYYYGRKRVWGSRSDCNTKCAAGCGPTNIDGDDCTLETRCAKLDPDPVVGTT